ncbi:MAG TPA: glucose 1-dehydrogenase [Nitrososphaerales archaeon]|nr:glucose 1-dehydrogenase [Nitrososphaerales archaeon]
MAEKLKSIVVTPKQANSLRLIDSDIPSPKRLELQLQVQKIGICGTDRDIISGFYGESPIGSDYLVIGHESLSRVSALGAGVSGFKKGDLVVPTVRRNCPENCLNCKGGQSDMCLTGHYQEHGIKGLHGFAREFAISDSRFVVKLPETLSDVGVLLEPLTVVEKGELQSYKLEQGRMKWKPTKAIVLGAGPVGLLATALLRLRDLDVDTVATRSMDSPKAKLVQQTGATYVNAKETPLNTLEKKYDIVLEVTGNPSVAFESQRLTGVNGVVCLLGIYDSSTQSGDAGKQFTDMVLGNKVLFGSVNANKTYFERGVRDLLAIRKKWSGFLEKIITRRATYNDLSNAYRPESEEEIKTIVQFTS